MAGQARQDTDAINGTFDTPAYIRLVVFDHANRTAFGRFFDAFFVVVEVHSFVYVRTVGYLEHFGADAFASAASDAVFFYPNTLYCHNSYILDD